MGEHKGETSKAEQVKAKSVESREVRRESEKFEAVKGDGEQIKPVMSGFMVFRNEYVAKLGEKKRRMADESRSAGKAWRELPEAKKKEYNDKAMEGRPKRKMTKKELPFHTRCSLGGFTSLVQFVNGKEHLKERVKKIGFGNLLKVQLDRLPRDLIVSMLRAYDPATHQFRIRGKTKEIEASDVHKLLGIPHSGEEVKVDVEDSNRRYQWLKREYGRKKYTDILKHIKSGTAGDKFEFMFVLYSLGTLLCPTSSGLISDRMLRVMFSTMDRFEHYDWATYMMKDLWKEMSDYVKEYKEKKKREGSSNVGGCLYLLLLFFGENFPLKQSIREQSTTPIEFWTKEKINEMVKTERTSNMGILYKGKGSEVRAGNEDTDNVPYLDPELKEVYARLVKVIDENRNRLVNVVVQELLNVQLAREARDKAQQDGPGVTVDEQHTDEDDDDATDASHDSDSDDTDAERYHVDDDEDDDAEGTEVAEKVPTDDHAIQRPQQVRRSKRQLLQTMTCPFIPLDGSRKRKTQTHDQKTLFNIVSTMARGAEAEVSLVQILDEELCRDQLYTLGGIQRLSNTVMSVMCKALMYHFKVEGGQPKRHIFDAWFMTKLVGHPIGWKVSSASKEFSPKTVGYNIGECELIMGSALVRGHWFCVALETKSMTFYVLDSMKPDLGSKKTTRKGGVTNDYIFMVNLIRDRFVDIMHIVNPHLAGKKKMSDIVWPPVVQQNNLRDCGVHVIIWLSQWTPKGDFHYENEQIQQLRSDIIWWLVNHPLNLLRDTALALIPSGQKSSKDVLRLCPRDIVMSTLVHVKY